MRDWSSALAHAWERHLAETDGPVAHPAGTGGTGRQSASVPRRATLERKQSQGFGPEGTGGTTGTTQIEDALHWRADVAFEERAAIIEDGAGVPREWAEAFAHLDLASRPPACSEERWRQIIDDGGRFIDRWGNAAARLGWQAIDVFGTKPNDIDVDGMRTGLVLLIRGGAVERIAHDRASIRTLDGGTLVYLRRPRAGHGSDWERTGDTPIGDHE